MKKNIILSSFLFIVVVGAIGTSVYFYREYVKVLKDPQGVAKAEGIMMLKKIQAFMELPDNEEPSIVSVFNKDELKAQPFFARSENGDKVIVYRGAQKAILYRPSLNRVIEVAPLVIQDQTTSSQISPEPGQRVQQVEPKVEKKQVAIYNATKISGLTDQFEERLKSKFEIEMVVVVKENALRNNYSKTLVIDLGEGSNTILADQLARELNGVVSELPAGEKKPTADILVIAVE